MNCPKVSIIVVNYNGLKFLKPCLDSLQQIDYPDFEIVVVDNGSWDGSRKFMFEYQNKHRDVVFMDYFHNRGLAQAQNDGVSFANGEYFLFLNNDVLVDKHILTNLVKTYEGKVGVLGCRMGNYDGTRELDSAISVDRFCYPCGKTANMFYPDGAIFTSRKVFDDVGGFDGDLFLFGEDRDFCWRVWLSGYFVLCCNTAIFYHASSCVVGTNYFRRRLAERNIICSIIKNYSAKSLARILPQYVAWAIVEWVVLIVIGQFKALGLSYLPAYWWNLTHLRQTMEKRQVVQAKRRVDDDMIRKVMSRRIGKVFVFNTFGIPKFYRRQVK